MDLNSHGACVCLWSGYTVENGPAHVAFKASGLRVERFVPITNPTQMPFSPLPLAPLWTKAGGQASHIGLFTDLKKIGPGEIHESYNCYLSGGRALSQAVNGDLLNWVAFGTKNPNQTDISAFFAGGTGRFEHVSGSWGWPITSAIAGFLHV